MAGAAHGIEGDKPSQHEEHSHVIECPSSVLHGIRAAVLQRFNSQPHGGAELFGVLFGKHDGGDVHIKAFRALTAENDAAHSGKLSGDERTAFAGVTAAAASDGELAELEPVGWFRTHPRSDLKLSERDVEIANALFPQVWQVTMILRPGNSAPSRGRIFFRESPGPLAAGAGFQEFTVEPAAIEIPTGEPMADAQPVANAQPITDPPPAASAQPQTDMPQRDPPQAFAADLEEQVSETAPQALHIPMWRVALSWPAALIVVAGLVAVLYWFGRPPQSLALRVFDNAGQLRITWDRTVKPVRQGQSAHLEITDGGANAWIELDREQLRDGNVTYMRHSSNVTVRLVVPRTGAAPLEEVARFLGPAGSPPASASVQEPAQSGGASRLKTQPPADAGRGQEKPAVLVVSVPVEPPLPGKIRPQFSAPPAALQTAAASSPSISDPAPPPVVTREVNSAALPPLSHAEPPVEKPAPPRPPATNPPAPAASSPLTSPPASSPASQPAVQSPVRPMPAARPPAAPASGRAIWIGRLQKNQTLTITGKNCSTGTLIGELPARPFKFSLSPGDLSSDGIVLYTSNSQYANNVVEPPGAENGWNKTIYTWNPKFANDVTMQEPPAPRNEWRVTLRSKNPKISVIVIDWALVN